MRDTETDMKSECRPTMVLRRSTSWLGLLGVVANLGACAVSPAGHGTAADMFYKLNSNSKRQVASDFYKMGVSDDVKNLYWAQRRMQEPCYDDERAALQRKYVTVWVPEQKGPDGTITEGHYKVIEVIE
jgi:hypothetical protein